MVMHVARIRKCGALVQPGVLSGPEGRGVPGRAFHPVT